MTNDEFVKHLLDLGKSLGIGYRQRTYDGDAADLVREGRTDFAPAAAITLYFDGPRERYADGVVACWEEFAGAWGGSFRWYADEDHGEWRPPTAKLLRRPVVRIRSRKAMPFYAWMALSGEHYEHASPVTFHALVRDGEGGNLSFLRATFPTARVAGEAAADEFLETVKRWCARIPIRHGYAGLAVNESPRNGEQQMNSPMLLKIAIRFNGLEIDDCGGTVLVARDHIKGVNWLTLLGDEFVRRLGGLPALRSRLSAAVALHPAAHGSAVVQAGRVPSWGDTQKGDDLSLYQEVARVLRPVCLQEHPPFESFGAEGTKQWLRRFE